jgi:hypothetical protein
MELGTFKTVHYKPRFLKIKAYQLPEESNIHCANGQNICGKMSDFYVSIDAMQEMIIPEIIFKKLFVFDQKENE